MGAGDWETETRGRIAEAVKAWLLPNEPLTSTSDGQDPSQLRALAVRVSETSLILDWGMPSYRPRALFLGKKSGKEIKHK